MAEPKKIKFLVKSSDKNEKINEFNNSKTGYEILTCNDLEINLSSIDFFNTFTKNY